MKNDRQSMILEIISQENIETQEQLLARLQERGITSTQATISRDIKQMHLIKEPVGHGVYKYAVSGNRTKLNFRREAADHLPGEHHQHRERPEHRGGQDHAGSCQRRLRRTGRHGDHLHGGLPGGGRHRLSGDAGYRLRSGFLPGDQGDAVSVRSSCPTGRGNIRDAACPSAGLRQMQN